jgi:cytochrome c1
LHERGPNMRDTLGVVILAFLFVIFLMLAGVL